MASFQRTSLSLVPDIVLLLMKNDRKESIVPCQILENYGRCSKVVPDLDIRLFTPGGGIDAYGTFFLLIPEHRYNMVFHSLDQDLDGLRRRILAIPDIDWDNSPMFGPLHGRFDPMVMQIVKDERLNYIGAGPADSLSIPREQALNLPVEVPQGFELRPITTDQAGFINDRWPFKGPGSNKYIKDVILTNGGIALHRKDSGEMIAWALFSLVGGVGMAQTVEEYRGKGYGSIVSRALTRIVAEAGVDPQVQIKHGLDASLRMFTRMGYTITHIVHWYYWIGRLE